MKAITLAAIVAMLLMSGSVMAAGILPQSTSFVEDFDFGSVSGKYWGWAIKAVVEVGICTRVKGSVEWTRSSFVVSPEQGRTDSFYGLFAAGGILGGEPLMPRTGPGSSANLNGRSVETQISVYPAGIGETEVWMRTLIQPAEITSAYFNYEEWLDPSDNAMHWSDKLLYYGAFTDGGVITPAEPGPVSLTVTPEPATCSFLALGGIAGLLRFRRRTL